MITRRSRTSENIAKRQRQRKFANVSTSGEHIPLTNMNWSERWCTLPLEDETQIKQIYEFEVREDDVYVVTFPKCGTTWIQEATWLLGNDLDFATANSVDLTMRSVFMELSALYTSMPRNTIELSKAAKSPRVLKSHLPAHLIPKQIWEKKNKIIYCARNPKDTAVSYFHFHRGLGTWMGEIDEFVEDLINDDILYSPYWQHLMDFWQMRKQGNVFFTTYEDMKRDLRKVLIELNDFLEKPTLSDENLQKLEEHLSFNNMKASTRTNLTYAVKAGHGSPHVRPDFEFMRRGIVGSYRDELGQESLEKLDKWTSQNLAKYNVTLKEIFGEL
ncbi:luciferin sulfotransferase [Stomoxys calcitrans]|uniref:luciferin sulfotransferase n=1 Tax=Stomoxys calcitrans TaxID=35570 RepID=UPI0027E332DC|nr:luciferin sulfotransferase [Stomoxys calcitrans]